MTRLPTFAVPPEAMQEQALSLASFVGEYSSSARSPSHILAALCMMQAMDTELNPEGAMSPLYALLSRCPEPRIGSGDEKLVERKMPNGLDDQDAHPGFWEWNGRRTLALDADWAGTWMIHMGADPWRVESWRGADGWPACAAVMAALGGHAEVVRHALALPHAPRVQEFASMEVEGGPLARQVASSRHGVAVFEAMVEAGFCPQARDGRAHLLESASLEVARLYAEKGWWPKNEGRLIGAWQKQFGAGNRSQQDLADLCALQEQHGGVGTAGPVSDQVLAGRVRRLLLLRNSSSRTELEAFRPVKTWQASELSQVICVDKGPWRGAWPVWAAMAAAAGRAGLRDLPVPWAQGRSASNSYFLRRFEMNGNQEPDLSGTLEQEWRDGVPAVGWLAFAAAAWRLRKKENAIPSFSMGGSGRRTAQANTEDPELTTYWAAMARAFGVEEATLRKKAGEALLPLVRSTLAGGASGEPARLMIVLGAKALKGQEKASIEDVFLLLRAGVTHGGDPNAPTSIEGTMVSLCMQVEKGASREDQLAAFWYLLCSPASKPSAEWPRKAAQQIITLRQQGVAWPADVMEMMKKGGLEERLSALDNPVPVLAALRTEVAMMALQIAVPEEGVTDRKPRLRM